MAYIEWWNRTGPITLGERFGLNEISIARNTLSPTKSYIEDRIDMKPGGIVEPGVTHYAKEFYFQHDNPAVEKRAIELLNEGHDVTSVANTLEAEGLVKYPLNYDKSKGKYTKNFGSAHRAFKKLLEQGKLEVDKIATAKGTDIGAVEKQKRNAKILEIIEKNPDANPQSIAKKAKVNVDVVTRLAKEEGIDIISKAERILPEIEELDRLIKTNTSYFSKSGDEVSISKRHKFLFDEMKKKFPNLTSTEFSYRVKRLSKLWAGTGVDRTKDKIYKNIKAPLKYVNSILEKNLVGIVAKSGRLGVVAKAEMLGLPQKHIDLLRNVLSGARELSNGKIKIAGDHTDIDALMKMDLETYKKEFTRINIISDQKNTEKLAADNELIKLVKDYNNELIKPDEFKTQVETIRAKYKYLKVPLAKPIIKGGKAVLDFQTPRLIDLENPIWKTLNKATTNLMEQSGLEVTSFDDKLRKITSVKERFNLLKNAGLEQLNKSKILRGFAKMKGPVGNAAKLLLAGTITSATLATLASAGTTLEKGITTEEMKKRKEEIEPGDETQEDGTSLGEYILGGAGIGVGTASAKYGAWNVAKALGRWGIKYPLAASAVPFWQVGGALVETIKAAAEKRFPDYKLDDWQTWMHGAFWDWGIKTFGLDKMSAAFGESFQTLSKMDKARVVRNVAARGLMSPKTIKFISSKIAWPVTGALAYQDLEKWVKENVRKTPLTELEQKDIQKRKEAVPTMIGITEQAYKRSKQEGITYEDALKKIKQELADKETPLDIPGIEFKEKDDLAMGGIASLIKGTRQ